MAITEKYIGRSDVWKALTDASADAVIILDTNKIDYANASAFELFHKSATEVLGQPISVLASELKKLAFETKEDSKCVRFSGKYHNDFYELLNHYMCSTAELDLRRIIMSSKEKLLSVFCGVFRSASGKHYLISIRDVTRIKETECSRAKSILLSSLSHELKTPLNAVMDTLKWFLRSMDNITKDGLKVAYASSRFLHNYVSNVLDYADYTNGMSLTVKSNAINIGKVIKKIKELYEMQVESCKVVFSVLVGSKEDHTSHDKLARNCSALYLSRLCSSKSVL